jgi:kynurenine 3-monooxygenase
LKALKSVGIEEEVQKIMIPMYGRMLHSPKGDLTFQSYSKDGRDAINSIGK